MTSMRTVQHAWRIALLVVGMLVSVIVGAHADMTWSGYTQARYNFWDRDLDKPRDFDLRRVRLKYAGTLNDRGTEAAVQVCLGNLDDRDEDDRRVVLKDAFVRHPLSGEWSARMGFTTIPFGFEEEYSSSKRLPFERSKAARSFFPGERETGFYLLSKPAKRGTPQLALGYSNGMRDWNDEESHAWTARAQWPLPNHGVAGVSYTDARRSRLDGEAQRDYDQNCLGAHLRWNFPSGLALQSEYFDGEILDVEAKGWYGQVEYAAGEKKAMPFYRYDVFDDGKPTSYTYKRHTVGAAWDFDKNQRVTVQVERYRDLKGGSYTDWGLQWQFKYGGK